MEAALFVAGVVSGLIGASGFAVILARSRMIEVHKSPLGFEETVARLESAIRKAGWMLPDSRRLNESLEKKEVFFTRQVHLIKLCEPHHAVQVLADNRHLACLMPCTFAVYEGDDDGVYVSKMNTRLMGKIFGGTVDRVMGRAVAREENVMLRALVGAGEEEPGGEPAL
jgi:uncharacterized protein (DUF302 family)